jgi:catechol-2,3-dioxygenase
MIIDNIALRADDIHKVSEWYQKNIGAIVTHEDKFYIRLSTSNTTIAIIDKNRYPYNHIGILIDSMDDLPDDGTRVEHRDGTIGVYCQDPEGNCIEFIYYTEELRPQFVTYGYTKTDSE